jgi:hypothetical protein
MFYPLLILFLIFLAVGDAAFCGPAFRVSSFGDTSGRVHSIKKTSSVFYDAFCCDYYFEPPS